MLELILSLMPKYYRGLTLRRNHAAAGPHPEHCHHRWHYWDRGLLGQALGVFLGYKAIAPDVLKIAELLKAQPLRDRSDVVLEGYYGGNPTIIRFSHRVDTPGLDIQMRVPAAISFSLLPKNFATTKEGRVLMRTGNASLDEGSMPEPIIPWSSRC